MAISTCFLEKTTILAFGKLASAKFDPWLVRFSYIKAKKNYPFVDGKPQIRYFCSIDPD